MCLFLKMYLSLGATLCLILYCNAFGNYSRVYPRTVSLQLYCSENPKLLLDSVGYMDYDSFGKMMIYSHRSSAYIVVSGLVLSNPASMTATLAEVHFRELPKVSALMTKKASDQTKKTFFALKGVEISQIAYMATSRSLEFSSLEAGSIPKVVQLMMKGSNVRGVMLAPTSSSSPSYYTVCFDKQKKENTFSLYSNTGVISLTYSLSSGDILKGLFPIIPHNSDGYHMAFIESMANISSIVLFKFGSKFSFESEYILTQELSGCPPDPCLKDRFTGIQEMPSGDMFVVFGFWVFKQAAPFAKIDYKTAESTDSSKYQFWSKYSASSFLKDKHTILFDPSENKVVTINPQRVVTKEDHRQSRFKGIPLTDALFYRSRTQVLYHMNKFKVRGESLATGSKVVQTSVTAFFGFNIFEGYPESHEIRATFPFKGKLYIFVQNWFLSISLSTFSESEHKFKPNERMERKCFSEFIGCPLIRPVDGVPDQAGFFPCGGLVKRVWDFRPTATTTTANPTKTATSAEPPKTSKSHSTSKSSRSTSRAKRRTMGANKSTPSNGLYIILSVLGLIAVVGLVACLFVGVTIHLKGKRKRFTSTTLSKSGPTMRSNFTNDTASVVTIDSYTGLPTNK